MLRAQRSCLLLLSILASGCGSYCAPNRNIRDRVAETVVVGTWQLTDESLRNLARDGFRRDPSHRYTITVNANHTCDFASVVQFADIGYIKTPCTWRLEHDVEGSSGRQANVLRADIPHGKSPFTLSLNFAREDGVLILWEFYSDPDLWQFLEYKK
jgi:hypothetical protein